MHCTNQNGFCANPTSQCIGISNVNTFTLIPISRFERDENVPVKDFKICRIYIILECV